MSLKKEILKGSDLILESVDWAEAQINEKIKQIDLAARFCPNSPKQIKLEKELAFLINRLSGEVKNMDNFLAKYKDKINEKKSLRNSGKKK